MKLARDITNWTGELTTSRNSVMTSDVVIRLSAFLGVLGLMASWEVFAPRRRLSTAKLRRWAANLWVVALDSVIVRLLFAGGAVGAALVAAERDWGVLNHLSWPLWLEFVVAVVVLDFVLYVQHVMFHAFPLLWRLHMMHHADLDCDVTTGLRFHPLEVIVSMVLELTALVLLGATPLRILTTRLSRNPVEEEVRQRDNQIHSMRGAASVHA